MIRVIIAGVLGAVVYFVWGMAAWMYLPLHNATIHQLDDETRMTRMLEDRKLETGVYVVPFTENPVDDVKNTGSVFYKKHTKGPIYSIYYQAEGKEPMGIPVLINGFIINLLAALLAAVMLSCAVSGSCKTYAHRVGFVTGFGVFVGLVGHASYWNWMHFPLNYSIMFMLDVLLGWLLVGLIMAAIIRSPAAGSATK